LETHQEPEKSHGIDDLILKAFRGLGLVMSKVGIAGFIVIAITVIVFYFSTPGQKNEIIDHWVYIKKELPHSSLPCWS
jgi:hypothetical protein